jgi:hypothetical protein
LAIPTFPAFTTGAEEAGERRTAEIQQPQQSIEKAMKAARKVETQKHGDPANGQAEAETEQDPNQAELQRGGKAHRLLSDPVTDQSREGSQGGRLQTILPKLLMNMRGEQRVRMGWPSG